MGLPFLPAFSACRCSDAVFSGWAGYMREQARLLGYDTNAFDLFVNGYPYTPTPVTRQPYCSMSYEAVGGGAGEFYTSVAWRW